MNVIALALSIVCTIIPIAIFIAGYRVGKWRGYRVGLEEGIIEGFKRAIERDAMVCGNGFMEIRRIDPSKVRLIDDTEKVISIDGTGKKEGW